VIDQSNAHDDEEDRCDEGFSVSIEAKDCLWRTEIRNHNSDRLHYEIHLSVVSRTDRRTIEVDPLRGSIALSDSSFVLSFGYPKPLDSPQTSLGGFSDSTH